DRKGLKPRVGAEELKTKTARAKLPARALPYYFVLGQGLELGYRKGKLANDINRLPGAWCIRRYVRGATPTPYRIESLDAHADDFTDANGRDVVSFWQAQDR